MIINIFLTIGLYGFIYYCNQEENIDIINENIIIDDAKEEIIINNTTVKKINVEVKGAVKKSGVYTFDEGKIINDAIKKAGGFLNNAYTANINLSKHLSDEMVIYVYTNDEHNKENIQIEEEKPCICEPIYIDSCLEKEQSIIIDSQDDSQLTNEIGLTTDDKININTASKENLTSLNGIGDAKANGIIEYRNTHGLFKSIEEIMNVSGISESVYAKIKNNITI